MTTEPTQFEKVMESEVKCYICGGVMLAIPGGGWDNDRFLCADRECWAEIVYPTSTLVEETTENNDKPELSMSWYDKVDRMRGWGLYSNQPWLKCAENQPAHYMIRRSIFEDGYSLWWWHGDQDHVLASNIPTIEKAKERALNHLQNIVDSIYLYNSGA